MAKMRERRVPFLSLDEAKSMMHKLYQQTFRAHYDFAEAAIESNFWHFLSPWHKGIRGHENQTWVKWTHRVKYAVFLSCLDWKIFSLIFMMSLKKLGNFHCCFFLVHNAAYVFLDGGKSEWINDGFCDDMNNNVACDYDGGDCCGTKSNKFCLDCKCICK